MRRAQISRLGVGVQDSVVFFVIGAPKSPISRRIASCIVLLGIGHVLEYMCMYIYIYIYVGAIDEGLGKGESGIGVYRKKMQQAGR